MSWRDEAACRDTDPDLWFPDHQGRHDWTEAKAICATCPVLAACRKWALNLDNESDAHGFMAGMSAWQRRETRYRTNPSKWPMTHGSPYGFQTHRRRGEPICDLCKAAQVRRP